MKRVVSPTLLAFASSAGLLFAAESAAPSSLPSITVSAPREALTASSTEAANERLASVPGGTSVVGGDELAKSRTVTLRDAFAGTPGVYAQPRYGSEESRLSIRGSGIQRTFHLRGIALLMDGQPINQADGGADFQAIDLATAEHIEVFRGANGLQYGAANLGGAINVVLPTGYTAPAARLRLEGGSFGLVKGTAESGFVDGALDGVVSVSGYRQDGFRDHSHQQNQRASGNLGWRVSDHLENRLYLGYFNSDSELPGAITKTQMIDNPRQANAASAKVDSKRDFPLYRIADRLSVVSGSERLDVGAGWIRKDLYHPLGFALIRQFSQDWSGNAQFSSDAPWFGRGNRLVVGVNGYLGSTDAEQYGYANPAGGNAQGAMQANAVQVARTIESYGEIRHEVIARWWAIAGAQAVSALRRFDDRYLANGDQSDSKTYGGFSPKIGALHDITDHAQAFANLSRSFEPPTFAEYVATDTAGQPPRPQSGLEAQSAWTAELGTRGHTDRAAWDITPYYAWVQNEYLAYQVAPGLSQTVNADRTIHAGVELGLTLTAIEGLFAERDQVVVAQVWNWGRFRFDNDPVYGNAQLPGLPEHTWRGDLRWEHRGWYAGPVLEWQQGFPVDFAGTLEADAVWLVGARAGYQDRHGWSAFVEGRNLVNVTYAATTGVANPTQAAANQALFNPGDGIGGVVGVEWRH